MYVCGLFPQPRCRILEAEGIPHTASSILLRLRLGSPKLRLGFIEKKGREGGERGQGRELGKDRVSAQVQPQPDPSGALQHELCQRAGPTLRQEGWLFQLLRHSGIDSRGGSREYMSSWFHLAKDTSSLGEAGSSKSLVINIHNWSWTMEAPAQKGGSGRAPRTPTIAPLSSPPTVNA